MPGTRAPMLLQWVWREGGCHLGEVTAQKPWGQRGTKGSQAN